jgi:hypothetical protein
MRGVKNFAYDLDMIPGAVNSRVVLLLRSIEAKPWHLIFERNLPIIYSVRRVFEGVWAGAEFVLRPNGRDKRVGGL